MTIGSYTLLLNEAEWLPAHLSCFLPYLDQIVFFDGGSTDGSLEIVEDFQKKSKHGHKITLVKNKNPKNLKDAYVRMFNECMWTLKTDWAIFLHPDFWADNPEALHKIKDGIAYYTHVRSFAGEPGGQLYEFTSGRSPIWTNIHRLRNPSLGAHYFGHYGAWNEGTYFSEITGEDHFFYGSNLAAYPYEIKDSGLKIRHFSDVRPYERRLGRMKTCLINQGRNPDTVEALAKTHPRVNFQEGGDFRFKKAEYPDDFKFVSKVYAPMMRGKNPVCESVHV